MFVIVDERDIVTSGYAGSFGEAGVASAQFDPARFRTWVRDAPPNEVAAVEAFLLGACPKREEMPPLIRRRSRAPVIALNEMRSLDETLGLFSAGVDDVVRKPVHVRELLARAYAIQRRAGAAAGALRVGEIECRLDGADPLVGGQALHLPRRERRILEYLVGHAGRRATKAEIAAAIYGADIDATVIESHICRLRKKLRQRLGYDPISCERHLGYKLRD